jgi:hypothetical protein
MFSTLMSTRYSLPARGSNFAEFRPWPGKFYGRREIIPPLVFVHQKWPD